MVDSAEKNPNTGMMKALVNALKEVTAGGTLNLPTFEGKPEESVSDWIYQCVECFAARGFDNQISMAHATTSVLRGEALDNVRN
jgi:hypothetical protein